MPVRLWFRDVGERAAGGQRRYGHRWHRTGRRGLTLELDDVDAALGVGDEDVALVPVGRPGVGVVGTEVTDLADVPRVGDVEEPRALGVVSAGEELIAAVGELVG